MKPYKDKGFFGVIGSNEINTIPNQKRVGFVMNTDPNYKSGKHWVGVYIDARPHGDQVLEYYDSFGDPPSDSFMKDIKNLIDKINPNVYLKFKINRIKHQSVSSENCGYFAMKFLMDRFNDKDWKDCSGYSDVLKSEKQINQFKKKFVFI